MRKEQAQQLLRAATQNPAARFRPGQWEAIERLVLQRKKLLVVQRTGWGKSLVYFLATRLLRDSGRGPTIIISPLLALMRNQLEAAGRLGLRAITINSTNRDEYPQLVASILADEVDCLLISPERLANEEFMEDVLRPILDNIGLLVVDEAHCISDWGHDFRPDYRRLLNILQQMPPNMPILGTTATANNRVIHDIQTQLGDMEVQRGPLVRDSLALQNLSLPDQASRLAWLAETIPTLEGTGIVYVLTKRDAEQVTRWLRQRGMDAHAYYSGVTTADHPDSTDCRQHLEDLLLHNRIKVLVATTALGMGYDKPDLHFVIHYQTPGSVVAYYQQVGRAGRGISTSYGIMLSGHEDENIHEYFRRSSFPSEARVQQILSLLDEHDGLSQRQMEQHLNLRFGQIGQVLKYLSVERPAPVIRDGSSWFRTPVNYQLDQAKIARLTHMREQEWQQMQDYAATNQCLMAFLQRALDDPDVKPCGRCANCLGRPLFNPRPRQETVVAAARFLRHSEFPLVLNKQVARDAFTTYEFSGNLPQQLRAEEGRTLSRWGDAAWGGWVRADKHAGTFRDALVAAMAEMIRKRWQPAPPPQWVTCVSSLRHPDLVPDFARRLAVALELPFHPVVQKVLDNPPQKLQENRFHQCRNLDGAFEIQAKVPQTAVLLVDDVVDSGWTMTIVAALLRQAGSGAVLPVALASTTPGG